MVQPLVREDPTCYEATTPVHHSYLVPVPESLSSTREATAMRSLLTVTRESQHAAMKTQHSTGKKIKNKKIPQIGWLVNNRHLFLTKEILGCLSRVIGPILMVILIGLRNTGDQVLRFHREEGLDCCTR